MSTQSVAWCLKAVGMFAGLEKRGSLMFNYSYNGKDVEAKTDLSIAQVQLPVDGVKSNSFKIGEPKQGNIVRSNYSRRNTCPWQ